MASMASLLRQLHPPVGRRMIACSTWRLDRTIPNSAADYLYRERASLGRRDDQARLRSTNLPKIEMTEEQRDLFQTAKACTPTLDWEGAMEVYRQVPMEVDESWQPVLRSVLNCLCKALRYKEATMVFERFPQRDTLAYNMFLQMLSRMRYTYQFDKALQRMEAENVPQSSVTVSAIMSNCKENNDWAQALQLLESLKSATDTEASIEVPYLLAMTACARARQRDKANELLQEIRSDPELRTKSSHYNALIVACGQDADGAKAVFEQLKADGFEPGGADWRALMMTHREDQQGQRGVYEEMRKQCPYEPPEEAWAILLRSAVVNDSSEGVNWVIEEMTRNGCEVTSDRAQSCPSLRRAIAEMHGRQQSEKDLGALQGNQTRDSPTSATSTPAAPASDSEDALPSGWSSTVCSATGKPYYWNLSDPNNTVTWERPK